MLSSKPRLIHEDRPEYRLTPEQQAEKDAYLACLRALLKDSAFRATEMFPHATDEAILALSRPPYYTACPNPFLAKVLKSGGLLYSVGELQRRFGDYLHTQMHGCDVSNTRLTLNK